MLEVNRARLLSVVRGDWSPYTRERPQYVYGLQDPHFTECFTDYDLLRHDIHVLLHAASTPTGESEK